MRMPGTAAKLSQRGGMRARVITVACIPLYQGTFGPIKLVASATRSSR